MVRDELEAYEECLERLRSPRDRRDVVYVLLTTIPASCTVTYGVLASLTGTSPRAVGAYMRSNRCLVLIPCHRVVSSRGLGGFSRGLGFKRKLLQLEGWNNCTIRSIKEFWELLESGGRPVDVEDLWV